MSLSIPTQPARAEVRAQLAEAVAPVAERHGVDAGRLIDRMLTDPHRDVWLTPDGALDMPWAVECAYHTAYRLIVEDLEAAGAVAL
jgi:hypothetical protein